MEPAGEQLAPLPRALEVQRFAGAREQEIRALCAALKGGPLGAKLGVAALPRHLRRRAGSHKPYNGHRFRPNAMLAAKRCKVDPAAEVEVDGSTGAAERAAGEATAVAARPFTNRRMRRQPAALQQRFRQSAAWTEASLLAGGEQVPAEAGGAAGTGGAGGALRRLETHVWHAKRLAMEERYGWLLPAGAAGQGRSSRSFVHVAKASALAHDASYHCPLLLSGTWRDVHAVLAAVLDPGEAAALQAEWADGGGGSASGWETTVVLHRPGRWPLAAICPAQLLLCPVTCDAAPGGNASMDVDGSAAGPAEGSVQALLWLHPAAAAEAASVLRAAAAAPEAGSAVGVAVLDARRLEIRGGAADAALAVALAGATAADSATQQQQQAQGAPPPQQGASRPSLPPLLAALQHGEAVQVLLPDPRLVKPVVLGSASASLLAGAAEAASGGLQQQAWDVRRLQGAAPPLTEAEVSGRRQRLRRQLLGLEPVVAGSQRQQQAPQREQEREQEQLQRGRFCPALLVRHDAAERGAVPGWSLVLPGSGWVAPFWLAAAYAGCKPAGQREWRWLHALQQQPCFPWDHPGTAAYAGLMQQQRRARQAAAARRPPGRRQLAAPAAPPDWARLPASGDTAPQAAEHGQQEPVCVGTEASEPALYVARTRSAMVAALPGGAPSGGSSVTPAPGGGRPVAAALLQGLLRWQPRQGPASAAAPPAAAGQPERGSSGGSNACCLLLALVQPIGGGAAAEGAALCFLQGGEAQRRRSPVAVLTAAQRRRAERQREELEVALLESGGDPEAAQALAAACRSPGGHDGGGEAAEESVRVFGYVTSEAPRGAPRRCGALAAVHAGAAWRLRALQHWGPRLDGGAIEAYARNPGSASLFPVRLRLMAELEGKGGPPC